MNHDPVASRVSLGEKRGSGAGATVEVLLRGRRIGLLAWARRRRAWVAPERNRFAPGLWAEAARRAGEAYPEG